MTNSIFIFFWAKKPRFLCKLTNIPTIFFQLPSNFSKDKSPPSHIQGGGKYDTFTKFPWSSMRRSPRWLQRANEKVIRFLSSVFLLSFFWLKEAGQFTKSQAVLLTHSNMQWQNLFSLPYKLQPTLKNSRLESQPKCWRNKGGGGGEWARYKSMNLICS